MARLRWFCAAVGDVARADVVEEPAPLVVVDEQDPAPVLRRLDEGVDDVGHERLADADVAVRVLVAGGPLVLPQEGGVDERDVGELAGGGVGVELRARGAPRRRRGCRRGPRTGGPSSSNGQ